MGKKEECYSHSTIKFLKIFRTCIKNMFKEKGKESQRAEGEWRMETGDGRPETGN